MKAGVLAVFVITLATGTILAANPGFDYQRNLGVALDASGRVCLDIRNHALTEGQRVQFINTDPPPTVGEAEIVRKLDEACFPANRDVKGISHYELKVVRGALTQSAPAFAIAQFSKDLTVAESGVTGDLDGDGHSAAFRSCTSTEGVHLTVWKGEPLRGVRKWHFYYYLGYNVRPSCTNGDIKPGNR